jgi:hypothetical protein
VQAIVSAIGCPQCRSRRSITAKLKYIDDGIFFQTGLFTVNIMKCLMSFEDTDVDKVEFNTFDIDYINSTIFEQIYLCVANLIRHLGEFEDSTLDNINFTDFTDFRDFSIGNLYSIEDIFPINTTFDVFEDGIDTPCLYQSNIKNIIYKLRMSKLMIENLRISIKRHISLMVTRYRLQANKEVYSAMPRNRLQANKEVYLAMPRIALLKAERDHALRIQEQKFFMETVMLAERYLGFYRLLNNF